MICLIHGQVLSNQEAEESNTSAPVTPSWPWMPRQQEQCHENRVQRLHVSRNSVQCRKHIGSFKLLKNKITSLSLIRRHRTSYCGHWEHWHKSQGITMHWTSEGKEHRNGAQGLLLHSFQHQMAMVVSLSAVSSNSASWGPGSYHLKSGPVPILCPVRCLNWQSCNQSNPISQPSLRANSLTVLPWLSRFGFRHHSFISLQALWSLEVKSCSAQHIQLLWLQGSQVTEPQSHAAKCMKDKKNITVCRPRRLATAFENLCVVFIVGEEEGVCGCSSTNGQNLGSLQSVSVCSPGQICIFHITHETFVHQSANFPKLLHATWQASTIWTTHTSHIFTCWFAFVFFKRKALDFQRSWYCLYWLGDASDAWLRGWKSSNQPNHLLTLLSESQTVLP